ncbi:MAG: long-chain acyl-CoA synthetase [Bryobacterales bacterium]|nr:long-chain acyl-CoA synthetase [Bryobacterales bacterium]
MYFRGPQIERDLLQRAHPTVSLFDTAGLKQIRYGQPPIILACELYCGLIGNPPSLAAFFTLWSRNRGEFLRYEGDLAASHLTYAEAGKAALSFAAHLRAAGIRKGERILLWSENRPEWVVALWACLLEGVVAVPIDFRSSAAVVSRVAAIVEAKVLLMGEGMRGPEDLPCPTWPMRLAIEVHQTPERHEPAQPADLAEILFTSGATGEPRGVTITHRNILANLKPIDEGISKYRKYMGPFKPIRFLNLLPLSHMFGQSMAAFIPPMIEGQVFFTSGYGPRDVVQLIRRRRISVLVCVPQMLELLRYEVQQAVPESNEPAKSAKWYARWWQYRRVRRRFGWKFWSFVVGAAPLDPELEEFWRKLGYVVIQGYGLTETAPVATLNHPLETKKGTVGKAIAGVEIRIAPDGEILLRGENVTPGYYGETDSGILDPEGWLHTGDIGELDPDKRLRILGRKKEVIVSPDGLNVYPEDVERVLNAIPGVRESAVVATKQGAREQVHAVLVIDQGTDPEAVVSQANARLEPHQRIRGFSLWPDASLPRTSGTKKLKRTEVAKRVAGEATPNAPASGGSVEEVLRKYAGSRQITAESSLDDLGLSSLDRIQLLMELEQRTGTRIDELQFAQARTVADLTRPSTTSAPPATETFEFPEWNRGALARALRRIVLPTFILPLARLFAWIKVEGLANLKNIEGPVIFAVNHQSHFDVPSVLWSLPARWRYRVAPAMAKEFFEAHFHPERYSPAQRFTSGLNYTLSSLVFNAFPLPQRESGTRNALRYAGDLISDGYSILIFPEGKRTDAGEILPFQPGVGMLAARLRVPVVPVRVEGLERVLHKSARWATPGRARVAFGAPMRFEGDDYKAVAKQIEDAVRAL